jgi:enterochelin esterase-like enzyme
MRSEATSALVAIAWSVALGCARRDPPAPHAEIGVVTPAPAAAPSAAPTSSVTPVPSARELTWTYPETALGPMNVVVSIPAAPAGERFPVLVAFHGRGEALKGPARGARGWVDDYDLYDALTRLSHPPLAAGDFRGFASGERLRRMNESLIRTPFRGLVIVMPYTPDMLRGDQPIESSKPLARFVVDELLPRVYRETPALGTAATTGIDGVSLGGRASISVGLLRPRAFGAVAALQAAFDSDEVAQVVEQAHRARAENPTLTIRLVTSDGDYYLDENRELSNALHAAGIAHRLLVVSGPHDYVFNRGAGAYEMLLFHDRTLRGEPPP